VSCRVARHRRGLLVAAVVAAAAAAPVLRSQALGEPTGAPITAARDPAWSPDGARIAVSILDQIFVMQADGTAARPVVAWADRAAVVERDPAWARDGQRLAFAADRGDGYDIYVVDVAGGTPRRVTLLPGDERSPTWTPDGRLVFSHRARDQWDLAVVNLDGAPPGLPPVVHPLTRTRDDERYPAVSPDGAHLAYASSASDEPGQDDLWVRRLGSIAAPFDGRDGDLEAGADEAAAPVRVTRSPAYDSHPAWSPDGGRLAYAARRDGQGGVWVLPVPEMDETQVRSLGDEDAGAARVLVSRQAAAPAWSPDGRTLLLADLADLEAGYNGAPARSTAEPPPLYARTGAYRLRTVPAPLPPDTGEALVVGDVRPSDARWTLAFDRTWQLLRTLYYTHGPSADTWDALRTIHRPRAAAAETAADFERVVDELVAAQPLVHAPTTSSSALVVSGHRLATEVGRRVLEQGGNVVDAAVAVSFALGVVEPDASGIGGDGMALVLLEGMEAPVAIDFKDQSPIHATLNNAAIFRDGRLVGDGPAAANIPGVVAGMDHLYRTYGSKRLAWRQLIEPAARLAEDGFVLDESLPSTLREGRALLERHAESRRLFLPEGRVPRPGERFVNRDLGATLRAIAAGGAETFYRGEIARRIAEDMAASGGLIGLEDLAQYHVVERAPVSGRYRGWRLFGAPPPVPTGTTLIETLQILDRYAPARGSVPHRDADFLHHAVEAWKVRDPLRRVADPALWPVEVAPHLAPEHAATLFEGIDPASASPFPEDTDVVPGQGDRLGRGTTAFVVADARGNVVVVTQTLSTWGGNFYVSKGLGFLYNNHLRGYRTTRGAYGQLLPLMRSSSTSAPTLLCDEQDGRLRPRLAVGAAGNAWIGASVYGIILAHVDGGLGAQAAVEAPRFLVTRDPADPAGRRPRVLIEDRYPGTLLDDLAGRGHRFRKIGRKGELRYGYAAAIAFDPATGSLEGGAEPRRSHHALAAEPATSGAALPLGR